MSNTGPPREPPDDVPALEAPHDAYGVLLNRDLVLYLTGRFMASIGQQMLTVAVGWELYERTASKLALGMVGLTQMLPMILFTLPAGHLADTHERRRIIILTTGILGVASLGLTAVSALQAPVFWTYFFLFVAVPQFLFFLNHRFYF